MFQCIMYHIVFTWIKRPDNYLNRFSKNELKASPEYMGSVLSVRIHLSRGGLLSLFFSSAKRVRLPF